MKNKVTIFIVALGLAILVFTVSGNEGSGHKQPLPHSNNNTMEQVAKSYMERKEAEKVEVDKRVTIEKKKIVKEYWNVPLSIDLQRYVRQLCKEYGVREELAYAVMKVESNFDASKISPTSDYGLFQVNQINFERLQDKFGQLNFLNSFDSAKAGIYMLSELQQQSSDRDFVLTAYNRGLGGARALASRGGFSTTYSQKVISTIDSLERVTVEVGE